MTSNQEKELYAIITPDPYGEVKTLVIPARDMGDIFTMHSDHGRINYKVQIVLRTQKWIEQFPEI